MCAILVRQLFHDEKKEEMRVDYFEPSLYKILRKLNLISKGTKSMSLKRFDKFNIFY